MAFEVSSFQTTGYVIGTLKYMYVHNKDIKILHFHLKHILDAVWPHSYQTCIIIGTGNTCTTIAIGYLRVHVPLSRVAIEQTVGYLDWGVLCTNGAVGTLVYLNTLPFKGCIVCQCSMPFVVMMQPLGSYSSWVHSCIMLPLQECFNHVGLV